MEREDGDVRDLNDFEEVGCWVSEESRGTRGTHVELDTLCASSRSCNDLPGNFNVLSKPAQRKNNISFTSLSLGTSRRED